MPRQLRAHASVPKALSAQFLSFYFYIFTFNYGEGLSYARLGNVMLWWPLSDHTGSLHIGQDRLGQVTKAN